MASFSERGKTLGKTLREFSSYYDYDGKLFSHLFKSFPFNKVSSNTNISAYTCKNFSDFSAPATKQKRKVSFSGDADFWVVIFFLLSLVKILCMLEVGQKIPATITKQKFYFYTLSFYDSPSSNTDTSTTQMSWQLITRSKMGRENDCNFYCYRFFFRGVLISLHIAICRLSVQKRKVFLRNG